MTMKIQAADTGHAVILHVGTPGAEPTEIISLTIATEDAALLLEVGRGNMSDGIRRTCDRIRRKRSHQQAAMAPFGALRHSKPSSGQ